MNGLQQAITGVEFSRKAATQGAISRHAGNYEWRTCARFLRGCGSGIRTSVLPNRKHRTPPLNHHAYIALIGVQWVAGVYSAPGDKTGNLRPLVAVSGHSPWTFFPGLPPMNRLTCT